MTQNVLIFLLGTRKEKSKIMYIHNRLRSCRRENKLLIGLHIYNNQKETVD
jgi:hypothetical protein